MTLNPPGSPPTSSSSRHTGPEIDDAQMLSFSVRCPGVAEKETRSIIVPAGHAVPAGTYPLLEFYCPSASCDCRRVVIQVHSTALDEVLATLNYGWERPGYYRRWSPNDPTPEVNAGVFLEPSGPQCEYSDAFLRVFQDVVLADQVFKLRVRRHYRMFKAWKPS